MQFFVVFLFCVMLLSEFPGVCVMIRDFVHYIFSLCACFCSSVSTSGPYYEIIIINTLRVWATGVIELYIDDSLHVP